MLKLPLKPVHATFMAPGDLNPSKTVWAHEFAICAKMLKTIHKLNSTVMGWFRFFNIHMAWPLSLVQPRKVFGWDFNRGLHPNAEGLQRRIRRQREGARALFRSQLDFSDIAKESHFQEAFKTIGVEISSYILIWRNSGKGYLLKTMLIARLQRQCRSRAEFMIAKARSV